MNQPQPGEVVVTQTDLLAQIGALTMENTVLKNQLGQAQAFMAQQAAEIDRLTNTGQEVAEDLAPTPIREDVADGPSPSE